MKPEELVGVSKVMKPKIHSRQKTTPERRWKNEIEWLA
jgi:hypothetical protein